MWCGVVYHESSHKIILSKNLSYIICTKNQGNLVKEVQQSYHFRKTGLLRAKYFSFKKMSQWKDIRIYWYYSFWTQIKVKNVENWGEKIKFVCKFLNESKIKILCAIFMAVPWYSFLEMHYVYWTYPVSNLRLVISLVIFQSCAVMCSCQPRL